MTTNGEHVLALAHSYVRNLRPENNRFASSPRFLRASPWEASTQCTSFLNLLLEQALVVPKSERSPNARSRYRKVESGEWPRIPLIMDLRPGAFGFIAYSEDRTGFSGHSFLVNSRPYLTGEMLGKRYVWGVSVIDSTRSSHGRGDTRWAPGGGLGGIGQGAMRFVCDVEGNVVGYMWSGDGSSEVYWCGMEQKVLFGTVPDSYAKREGVIHG